MKRKARNPKEPIPIRYWLVEITLTSGEGLQFYVSAINEHEAYLKADDYSELAKNDKLLECYKKMGFKLLP